MKKRPAITSRDLGLEFAALCGKYFIGLDHLHYGYWPEGLPVNISNLHVAQENYTSFLVSHIPSGVRTILDVGCGAGYTSKRLADMGYKVACLSPSPVLSGRVRELMGDACRVFECKYEDLQTEDRYDLVLFSESFQYIKMQKAMAKTFELLNPAGYMLICDIFRKDVEAVPDAKSAGGGHLLSRFYKHIANQPFEPVEDIDITSRTTPNLDLMDDAMKNVLRPVIDSSLNFLAGRYPLMSKAVRWLYRKRINKTYQRYFNGNRASEEFGKFKSYRLFLYRSTCAVPAGNSTAIAPSACGQTARPAALPTGV
jgi:SAM-dependent methyltransferase